MKKTVALSSAILLSGIFAYEKPTSYRTDHEQRTALHAKQDAMVEKLYSKWYSPVLRKLLTKRPRASRIAGHWAKSRISRGYIPRFVRNYAINIDEIADPIESFKTFNDFFIRKLKPAARPIAPKPNALASPADGSILVVENIAKSSLFPIKKVALSIEKMLDDEIFAALFHGGTAIIVRLAPWDYHRVHLPLSGTLESPHKITGRFESVSPTAYHAGVQPLEINERHSIRFNTAAVGTVGLVMVGALFVGAIKETYSPGSSYEKGDEFGYFEYGGSTIVMLFQKEMVTVVPELINNSREGKETQVKMGQKIGSVSHF